MTMGSGSTAVKASGSFRTVGGNTATVTLGGGTMITTMQANSNGWAVCMCGLSGPIFGAHVTPPLGWQNSSR